MKKSDPTERAPVAIGVLLSWPTTFVDLVDPPLALTRQDPPSSCGEDPSLDLRSYAARKTAESKGDRT